MKTSHSSAVNAPEPEPCYYVTGHRGRSRFGIAVIGRTEMDALCERQHAAGYRHLRVTNRETGLTYAWRMNAGLVIMPEPYQARGKGGGSAS